MTTYYDYFSYMLEDNEEFQGKFDTTAYLVASLKGEEAPIDGSPGGGSLFDALWSELCELCSGEYESVLADLVPQEGGRELAFVVFRIPAGQVFREASRTLRDRLRKRLPDYTLVYLDEQPLHCLREETLRGDKPSRSLGK